jgi:hypothetical protein
MTHPSDKCRNVNGCPQRVIVPLQGALYAQDFTIDTPIEGKGMGHT